MKDDLKKKEDKKIQDAHEAIRPTDITLTPVVIKESGRKHLVGCQGISSDYISLYGKDLLQARWHRLYMRQLLLR